MKKETGITSLQHLAFYPSESRTNYPTIVALHGRGADYNDLPPLIEAMKIDDLLVIAPRAPFPYMNGGFAWYTVQEEGVPSPESFNQSVSLLHQFLGEIKRQYPIDTKRTFLLGFSQGTVMAYAAGLADHASFRGIAAMSGYIPVRSGISVESDLSGLSVFISHGTDDNVIPVQFGRNAAQLLTKAGADVLYKEYSMGHQVIEETITDLAKWMKERIS